MSVVEAVLLFGGRDFRVAKSYRLPFVVGILSSLIALFTFRFISELIGDVPALASASGDYFAFVVVGMLLLGILDAAISAASIAVRQEQMQGTLEVLATRPLSPASLAAGWTAYPMLESIVVGLGTVLLAMLMGLRLPSPDIAAALLAIGLSAVTFAAIGVFAAAFVIVFQQGAALTKWVTSGLALISGVYFPLVLFPWWLQALAQASPMTHALRATRGALLEGRGVADLAGSFVGLAACAVVLLPLSVVALRGGLRLARARGTISTY